MVVLSVPLILTFSNSAVPLPSDDIFQPLNPLAKSLVCKIPAGFIIRFPPSIDAVVISHPPIDADLNTANPSASIDDEAFCLVEALPPMFAGVRMLFAVTAPNIVTPSVIVPPDSNTLDAVISPAAFSLSALSDDLISSDTISNPAIDADANLAKPSESIEDDAFVFVDGAPFIIAGVLI